MKKVAVLTLVLLLSLPGFTQKVYFIYFESENQQPFFARINDKVYSSGSSGYLILSKLRDSSYNINIGFPGSQSLDYRFAVTVNKKDQGFLVKNMGEKGLGLFDMQSMALLIPAEIKPDVAKTEKKEVTPFTDMLSKAVDDSTLKEKPVVVKEEKKVEPAIEIKDSIVAKVEEIKKEDSVAAKTDEVKKDTIEQKEEPKAEIKEEVKKDTVLQGAENKTEDIPVEEYKKSSVTRHSESSTTLGFGLTFFDVYSDGKSDTIKILIPNPVEKKPSQETKQDEKKFLDIPLNDSVQKQNVQEVIKPKTDSLPLKNNCNVIAVEEDFFSLRKDMAAETGDDNMIAVAMRTFKTKCFSTQQIKNLSALFLSDEGKYKFFDAVYAYVSDPPNFGSLQSELKDEYYINRFRAMLR